MSERISAAYDALFVSDALSDFADGAAAVELHLFAYLACLVSVYDRQPTSDWEYEFVATPAGAPYSVVLAQEIDHLRAAGLLVQRPNTLLAPSIEGRVELDVLRGLALTVRRSPYLEAACSAASLLPLPAVANAVMHAPGLQDALAQNAARELFDDVELMLVDEQFAAIARVLADRSPERRDLLVPTTLWLSYLTATASKSAA